MSQPLVIASYLPGEGHYRSDRHNVVPILCDDDKGYWRGIVEHWDHPAPIINVEHDLEVNDDQIEELFVCKYSLCSFAYPMHWISTGNHNNVWPHSMNGEFVQAGDEWATWSAIGFVKIAPEARLSVPYECHWRQMEDAIDKAVQKPWHLHWPPVPHHHW